MPFYGNYNDGIMPFTKKVVCRFPKKKNTNLSQTKQLSQSVVGYINGVTHFAS